MLIDTSDLFGTAEIAAKYGVGASAVANWRSRGVIVPIVVLACGPIYSASQVAQAMLTTGRAGVSRESAADALSSLERARDEVRRELRALVDPIDAAPLRQMSRPPRKLSGDGRGNGRGEWDWFYALSSAERAHLSRRWLVGSLAPDQYAASVGASDVDSAMTTWIAQVRLFDAAQSVLRGRAPRFGRITSSTSLDVVALFGPDALAYLASVLDAERDRYALTPIDLSDQFEEIPDF